MRQRTKRRYKRYWKNFKEVKLYILLRYISVLVLGVVLSSLSTLLILDREIVDSHRDFLMIMSIAFLIFLFLDIFFMRKDYYRISHRRKYIMVNGISHGMYTVTNIVAALFFSDTGIYAYLFGVGNIFNYAHGGISHVISAMLFNGTMIVAIQLAPTGLRWIQLDHG